MSYRKVTSYQEATRLDELAERWGLTVDPASGWLSFYCPFGGYLYAALDPRDQWWIRAKPLSGSKNTGE